MTTQSENKDKAEQKVSKDELSEKELEKTTGGARGRYQLKLDEAQKLLTTTTAP